MNVTDAALDADVHKIMGLSTDKAVNPVNLYGATKLVAEKLFVQANANCVGKQTAFSCVRYGNVLGSRGSVLNMFEQQRRSGKITITDPRMTRFWITVEQGVQFVIKCLELMQGGEIFVPKLSSMAIMDFANAIAADCSVEIIGIRAGEKLRETLVAEDEAHRTMELDDMYIIEPHQPWWRGSHLAGSKPITTRFSYSSDTNERWLTKDQLLEAIKDRE
jgi:UDP-N-acetylglucosamine 4,6-dehydratase/5-epimerase